jgi:hypothetical protein
MAEYNNAGSKKEKTSISLEVVRQIKGYSCRFLQEDDNGGWVEVSDDVARQKVSIGFRDLRKTKLGNIDAGKSTKTCTSSNPSSVRADSDDAHQTKAASPGIPDERMRKRTVASVQIEDSSTLFFIGLDGNKRRCRPCQDCNFSNLDSREL